MKAIVGLGNPGTEYESTRHNIGFMVLDELARRLNVMAWRDKFHGRMAKVRAGDEDLVLLKPMTFMNESGRCVQAASRFFRLEAGDILVVHDELDLDFGQIRLKVGGGHAGHNGLRSIIRDLNSANFVRLRLGIGKPPSGFRGKGADYVLSSFSAAERAELSDFIDKAANALELVVRRGVNSASNSINRRPKKPRQRKSGSVESPEE